MTRGKEGESGTMITEKRRKISGRGGHQREREIRKKRGGERGSEVAKANGLETGLDGFKAGVSVADEREIDGGEGTADTVVLVRVRGLSRRRRSRRRSSSSRTTAVVVLSVDSEFFVVTVLFKIDSVSGRA